MILGFCCLWLQKSCWCFSWACVRHSLTPFTGWLISLSWGKPWSCCFSLVEELSLHPAILGAPPHWLPWQWVCRAKECSLQPSLPGVAQCVCHHPLLTPLRAWSSLRTIWKSIFPFLLPPEPNPWLRGFVSLHFLCGTVSCWTHWKDQVWVPQRFPFWGSNYQ